MLAQKRTPQQRAAEKAQKLNVDDGGEAKRRGVAIDSSVLVGVQTGVTFPTRTRGATSVNAGVLSELRNLVKPLTIGDTFRLNAPGAEDAQATLATLVRKAINVEKGTDMGVNVAVQDGFMFVELKKRTARKPKDS